MQACDCPGGSSQFPHCALPDWSLQGKRLIVHEYTFMVDDDEEENTATRNEYLLCQRPLQGLRWRN